MSKFLLFCIQLDRSTANVNSNLLIDNKFFFLPFISCIIIENNY